MSIYIQYILFVLICVQKAFSKKELFGIIDRVELCGKAPSPKIKWENFTQYIENDTTFVSSDIEIFGDPITAVEVITNCQRCANREALDTCQNYHTLVTKNGCQFLSLDNLMWSPFIKAIRPEIKCPLKSGKYRQTKGWYDVKLFRMFPIEAYYWKLMITVISRRIHIITFCIDISARRKII